MLLKHAYMLKMSQKDFFPQLVSFIIIVLYNHHQQVYFIWLGPDINKTAMNVEELVFATCCIDSFLKGSVPLSVLSISILFLKYLIWLLV